MAINTNTAIIYITAMDIDSMVITGEQVAKVRDLLGLDFRTNDELGRLRNDVVRTLADASSAAREDGDMQAFDRLTTTMSAVTAVIDDTLWKRRALY